MVNEDINMAAIVPRLGSVNVAIFSRGEKTVRSCLEFCSRP